MRFFKIEETLLKTTNAEVMRRYCEQRTVVGRRMAKLVRSVPTRFVGMETCINRAIPKRRLKEISKLGYFIGNLHLDWT